MTLQSETGSDLQPGDILLVDLSTGDGRRGYPCRRILARAGSVRAGLYRIVARHGIDPLHPPEVHREARRYAKNPGVDDPDLVDLTTLPFVTIDNEDSKDLDQAMYLERRADGEGGGYTVWYALADASYFVRPGSALFAEALSRGASYYLPGLTVPMLPRLLSEDLVSLNQGQLRRSLVFKMRLDRRARCVETKILRGRICSARKLSYPGVQRYYDDPHGSRLVGQPWTESLELLREVGRLRIAEARRRHVIGYHRSELEISLSDSERLGFTMLSDRRLEVERYNEQISLLCNVEGARKLADAAGMEQVQAIFRVHPSPPPEALDSLAMLIRRLVERHELDPQRWLWRKDDSEPLADYLERLPRDRYHRLGRAIERQAMLSNLRSTFEDAPGLHHGIGAEVYARFSAPMREIVGIFTHKEAIEMLDGPDGAPSPESDEELRALVVQAGNRAKEVQRRITKDCNRLVLDRLLGSELELPPERRPRRRGTIMGLSASRLYLQLDDPAIDLKVYTTDLEEQLGCRLSLSDDEVALLADTPTLTLRIGDPLTVFLAGISQQRNRWIFHLAS